MPPDASGPSRPSDSAEVSDALRALLELGGCAVARLLCDKMVERGFSRKRAQLIIQRMMEDGDVDTSDGHVLSYPLVRGA